jgi:hypothetical protein
LNLRRHHAAIHHRVQALRWRPEVSAALDEAEGVATGVGHPGDAGAAADVLRLTGERGANLLYLGERGVEVGDTDVRHRSGSAVLMTMGVEPDLDTPNIEPDVEGLVGVGVGAEKGCVDGLGGVEDRADDGVQCVHIHLTHAPPGCDNEPAGHIPGVAYVSRM